MQHRCLPLLTHRDIGAGENPLRLRRHDPIAPTAWQPSSVGNRLFKCRNLAFSRLLRWSASAMATNDFVEAKDEVEVEDEVAVSAEVELTASRP
jgi:hypothetical protein